MTRAPAGGLISPEHGVQGGGTTRCSPRVRQRDGAAKASMGVDLGDIDGDLLITHVSATTRVLLGGAAAATVVVEVDEDPR